MRVCLKSLLSLVSFFEYFLHSPREKKKRSHRGVNALKSALSFFSRLALKEASSDESTTTTNSRAAAKGAFVVSRKRPRADTRVAREKETFLRRRGRRRYEQKRKRKRKRRRGSRFVFVGGGRHARQRGSQRAKRAEEARKESWRRRRRRVEVVVFRGFVVARHARLRADVDQRQDADFTDTGSGHAAIQGEEERGSDEHFRGFDDDGVDRRCHCRRG